MSCTFLFVNLREAGKPGAVILHLLDRPTRNQRSEVGVESRLSLVVMLVNRMRGALGEMMNWKVFGKTLRSIGPVFLLLVVSAPSMVLAQTGSAAPSAQRKTSTPYSGDLSIFETAGRDERLQINRVLDMLGIEPGKNVADIGAGSGWFTVRAARRVTGSGTVYAVDINPEAIQYIDRRAKKEQLHNIKTILSKPDDRRSQPTASTPC